jgi:NAD+ kinase
MIYGITGNPNKDQIWRPIAKLLTWLRDRDRPYRIHDTLAEGLRSREILEASGESTLTSDIAHASDLVLSFGGDGTLLRTAHATGPNDTPMLGVNIGRLGFLADTEVEHLTDALAAIEDGRYTVEERMVLEARADDHVDLGTEWALNEFFLNGSGAAGLLRIAVEVDGTSLNTYWADGLIFATPTGSTAYSLSTGGPILAPGVDGIVITPIASHTLTVRPIVLPGSVTIAARVLDTDKPYVFATDGRNLELDTADVTFTIQRADHTVNLVKLEDQHFFQTLRSKLMWGVHRTKDLF